MSIEYKVIGRHIRTARKRKNMTQEDVAAAIEMSPAHFGKVERGDRPVNLQRLSQLSQVPVSYTHLDVYKRQHYNQNGA